MKLNLSKTYAVPAFKRNSLTTLSTLSTLLTLSMFLTLLMLSTFSTGCKKNQLDVNEEKHYSQVDHVPANAYDGGFSLTLQPDGVADVNPGGDIVYRGTYKINGAKIKVKTPQNSASYTFTIISESEIKENQYGTILKLKQ
ncbi:hypothetical protein ABIB40_000699 [Pedobacter sp. UYP30]|uniref:hypothetical protein n=1 Tax=Pedobacter sp. UYP30 TaxID=1756400 RepID=UPI0033924F08